MHIRHSTKLTKLVVVGGLLWLAILLLLTMTDFATRGILGVPENEGGTGLPAVNRAKLGPATVVFGS
jgi:hypothetical protein